MKYTLKIEKYPEQTLLTFNELFDLLVKCKTLHLSYTFVKVV